MRQPFQDQRHPHHDSKVVRRSAGGHSSPVCEFPLTLHAHPVLTLCDTAWNLSGGGAALAIRLNDASVFGYDLTVRTRPVARGRQRPQG